MSNKKQKKRQLFWDEKREARVQAMVEEVQAHSPTFKEVEDSRGRLKPYPIWANKESKRRYEHYWGLLYGELMRLASTLVRNSHRATGFRWEKDLAHIIVCEAYEQGMVRAFNPNAKRGNGSPASFRAWANRCLENALTHTLEKNLGKTCRTRTSGCVFRSVGEVRIKDVFSISDLDTELGGEELHVNRERFISEILECLDEVKSASQTWKTNVFKPLLLEMLYDTTKLENPIFFASHYGYDTVQDLFNSVYERQQMTDVQKAMFSTTLRELFEIWSSK